MARLDGQDVLVLGGSSGIGLGVAQAALAAGANLCIAARNPARLAAALESLPGARSVVLDTADEAGLAAFLAEPVWDHVVISAAQTRTGGVRSLTLEEARAAMESKFWGAYRTARAAKIRPTGSLTLIAGGLAHRPSARAVLQGAINAALESLGRGLALELAPTRVNTISPGLIDTPMLARLGEEVRTERLREAASHLPVGRAGTAEDVAQAALMLMTNGFATGMTLLLDGGARIA